jgi:hypothetical protein
MGRIDEAGSWFGVEALRVDSIEKTKREVPQL